MSTTKPDPWVCKRGRTYLCEATGLSARSVDDLVAEGVLPGILRKGFVILTPGEYDMWLAGTWRSRPMPITDIKRRKAS